MRRKISAVLGVVILLLLSINTGGSGCSKKEPASSPPPEIDPTELPELEQNTLYRTNLPPMALPPVKDTSFTEIEDDLPEPHPADSSDSSLVATD